MSGWSVGEKSGQPLGNLGARTIDHPVQSRRGAQNQMPVLHHRNCAVVAVAAVWAAADVHDLPGAVDLGAIMG